VLKGATPADLPVMLPIALAAIAHSRFWHEADLPRQSAIWQLSEGETDISQRLPSNPDL
jgi:hypothetical protein